MQQLHAQPDYALFLNEYNEKLIFLLNWGIKMEDNAKADNRKNCL